MPPDPEVLVEAIQAVSGRHAGFRAVHARGAGAEGTFTATPAAAGLSRAAHLQGDPVPATVRFSNGSGNPDQGDGVRDGRGMATKLRLADGSSTDLVAISLSVFFVRNPDDFLAFMRARVPDPATGEPDMAKVGAFLGDHPEALPAVEQSLVAPAPESYLRCVYHGIHAFRFVDGAGAGRFVRYRWEPEEGVATISDEDAAARDPAYLRTELVDRLARRPAAFDLVVTLAADDDDPNDPTAAWPDTRPSVVAGRLVLDRPADPAAVEAMIFDPTRVVDGVECSDDAILHARSGAYGASYQQRTTTP